MADVEPFESVSFQGDENTQNSQESHEGDFDELSIKEQKRARYSQDTRHRKFLTIWVMYVVPIWLVLVIFIVMMCAGGVWKLSDMQMTTLLATTTANVLGLAYIVLKGLFK